MENSIKKLLTIGIYIAFGIFILLLFLTETAIPIEYLRLIGIITSISIAVVSVYVHWLWKLIPFKKNSVLYAKYSGSFTSSYDGATQTKTGELRIKQNLLSINVTFKTKESESISISSHIDRSYNKTQLIYTYRNTPNAKVKEHSPIHYGTAILDIDNPKIITGQYFTDRKTIGDMEFKAPEKTK